MEKNNFGTIYIVAIVACVAMVGLISILVQNKQNSYGQAVLPGQIIPEGNKLCTDSDGGQFYLVFGNVSGIDPNKRPFFFNDTCINNVSLTEYYCQKNNMWKSINYSCPNGCLGGACRSIPDSCTDPDGMNVLIKGNTYGYQRAVFQNFSDICQNQNTVLEYYCQGTTIVGTNTACPSNYICANGFCSINTSRICNDTDGGRNYNTTGSIYFGPRLSHTDYCTGIGGNTLVEYFCNGQFNESSENYPCIFGCENGRCLEASEICTEEWVCFNATAEGYQNRNCTITNISSCQFGTACAMGQCTQPQGGLYYVGYATVSQNCKRMDSVSCDSSYTINQETTLQDCCNSRFPGTLAGSYQGLDCEGLSINSCGCIDENGCDTLCSNHIQDGFETGVDCGGDCAPCYPRYMQYVQKGDSYMCRESKNDGCNGISNSILLPSLDACCQNFYPYTLARNNTGDSCYIYSELICE